ncbi:MAG: 3-deoxy-manno-octulosonate cytidylyltransferase [Fuerstiella sp.]|nr:3-deoxy-manno-octulosonate cytidylyltransferase [Fuerstiella sp.]
MKSVGLIPARLHSTRLPRKLLLDETGKPLIQYVWEVAMACSELSDVIVATDSEEIADIVRGFGGRAEMTGDHPSGSDRIAEVVRRCCLDAEVIVNLQGDEPELETETITRMLQALRQSSCEMATIATPFHNADDVQDPSCVKVVLNDRSEAMYFSRYPIPFAREQSIRQVLKESPGSYLLHLGMYAYRTEFLLKLTDMPPGGLENIEKLEQLRALQAGARIVVATVAAAAIGIDTPEDYSAFVTRCRR